MKKIAFLSVLLVVLVGMRPSLARALAQVQTANPTPIFEIALSPESPYPGQVVVATVRVQPYAEIKETLGEVAYLVQGVKDVRTGSAPEGILAFDETGKAAFSFNAPEAEDTYSLKVRLTAGPDRVNWEKTIPLVVETALPDPLARVLAGLGLFAAVMVIMAIGTEVVVELLKSLMGFKTKTTAMEALEKLKTEMPGAIAGLGINPNQKKDLEKILQGVKVAIQPASDLVAIKTAIETGDFGEAFQKIEALGKASTDEDFKKLKAEALSAVKNGFTLLYKKIPFAKDWVEPIREEIIQEMENAKKGDLLTLAERLADLQKRLMENSPEITAEWLRSQVDTCLQSGRGEVEKQLDQNLIKTFAGLGMPSEYLDSLKNELNNKLDQVESLARDNVSVYSLTVQNLLQSLENRRNEIQSPWRKFWRNLRQSRWICWQFYLVLSGLILLLTLAGCAISRAPFESWMNILIQVAIWLLAIGLMALLAAGLTIRLMKESDKHAIGSPKVQTLTLGDFLRFVVEKNFNRLIGHDASTQGAMRYGEVNETIQKQIDNIRPTTIAGILFSLDDLHQDQETSRVRLIRTLSIFIGIWLAYLLQIDSATYLNYAVPGVEAQINFIRLHDFWTVIPEKLTVGILLTGLAASAGSKFWRDLLTRLQETRGKAEEAARVVKIVQEMLPPDKQ